MTTTEALRSTRFPAELDREYSMLIDGEWVKAESGETFRCTDPYSGETWGVVPSAGPGDVARAVEAARRAFDESGWPELGPGVRGAVLRRLAGLIDAHAEELALVQVHENGKLLSEMLPGARALARQCEFTAGLGETLHGYTVASDIPGMTTYTVREPMGVVAAITPWNSPLGLLGFKLFPALATGCTLVIKPSEVTPTSTLRLAELCREAGVPDGAVNVVTGFGRGAGEALVTHPAVDKIAFTGSTATGTKIAQAAAARIARVSLELGGKSPNIVFPDTDMDEALHGAMAGAYAASGQTCVAGSRVLVHQAIHDDFVAALAERTRGLRLGDPLDASTQVGPLATRAQLDKVLGYVELGVSEGARLVAGGRRPDEPADVARACFLEPTVFADVDNSSRLAQEEVFGPVASVLRFEDEDDAVRIANDTRFGLAGAVWTRDIGRAQRMARRIRAGSIWVNTYRVGHQAMPFGGFKQSGLGREIGLDALHEYTEVKSVWLDHGNRQTFGR